MTLNQCLVTAKVGLVLMKKLAGITRAVDNMTLRRLCIGRITTVLDNSMAAWGTTAKSNFDQAKKEQNHATCSITGAMKSTPIAELETVTGF